jgi:hypothetical protein
MLYSAQGRPWQAQTVSTKKALNRVLVIGAVVNAVGEEGTVAVWLPPS